MGNDPLTDYIKAHGVPLAYQGVQPNALGFVEQGSLLTTHVHNSASGVTLNLVVRVLLPTGEYKILRASSTPATDRSDDTSLNMLLPRCYIIGVAIDLTAGSPQPGQCYVLIELDSTDANGVVVGFLGSGYITANKLLTWPATIYESTRGNHGAIRSITGTDPAAGAEISETVPTGALWRLLSVYVTLVTSATVGNRFPQLLIDDGTNNVWAWPISVAQAASTTRIYTFSPVGVINTTANNNQAGVLANNLLLPAGYKIKTSTIALDTGDNYGAPQLLVEEWLAN